MGSRGRWSEIATAITLLGGVALFACYGIDDNDPWWHLASARQILATGHLPTEDPFSFLIAGKPWVDEYWLFQVLMLGVWNVGGDPALTLFKVLWITGLFAALGITLNRRGVPWAVFALLALPALVALSERLAERPELATWAGLVAFLLLLPRGTAPPSRAALIALPLVQVLWTNSHPAFLLGPALIVLTTAAQIVNTLWRGEKPFAKRARSLLAWNGALLGLVLLASLLNPYGWRLHLLAFQLTGTPIFLERILEWQRPWQSLYWPSHWAGPILLAVTLPGLLLTWRRREAVHWVWLGAFATLASQAVRHGALFAWVALTVGAESWGAWWTQKSARHLPWRRAVAWGALGAASLLVMASITGWLWWALGSYRRLGLHPFPWRYPSVECDFVRAHVPMGNGFNDYNIGGYVMWRLFPGRRICIDGRLIVYGGALVREVFEITDGKRDWRPFFAAHGIHWALVANEAENLIRALWSAPDWHLVFAGPRALLFADDSPGQRDLIGQFAIEGDDLDALTDIEPTPSAPWWEAPATPYPEVRRSELLFILGRPDLASRVLERALVRHPRDARLLSRRALFLLHAGRVLMHRRAWSEAETALRTLVDFDPTSRDGWNNLGVLLARTGRPDAAREAWQRALALDPGNRAIQTNLQRLEARAGAASPEP
jgi:hypothetical protein